MAIYALAWTLFLYSITSGNKTDLESCGLANGMNLLAIFFLTLILSVLLIFRLFRRTKENQAYYRLAFGLVWAPWILITITIGIAQFFR